MPSHGANIRGSLFSVHVMPYRICMWTPEIIEHLAMHYVTQDEFEEVVTARRSNKRSDSSGRPAVVGYTFSGRRLFCVFEEIDEVSIEPVTAYEV
jgi:hypothetical protein